MTRMHAAGLPPQGRRARSSAVAGLACVCLAVCAGCASWSYRLAASPVPAGHDVMYLERVPPVAQRDHQCGPAALASVMRYWGADVPTETLAHELCTPGTRGVTNFLLTHAARARGFWTETPSDATAETLQGWLAQGLPPVVMLRVGPWGLPLYHFITLKGYDARARLWYATVGADATYALRDRAFRARWEDAGRWALLVCPPERVTWMLDDAQATELALLLERGGRLSEAERWYQRVVAHRPQDVLVRFDLANVYLQGRQFDAAKALYRQLVAEQPGWGPPSNNLAWIAVQEDQPQAAIAIIETAFAHGAVRDYAILDTLGLAYCQAHQDAAGLEHLQQALRLVPRQQHAEQQTIRDHLATCSNFTKSSDVVK